MMRSGHQMALHRPLCCQGRDLSSVQCLRVAALLRVCSFFHCSHGNGEHKEKRPAEATWLPLCASQGLLPWLSKASGLWQLLGFSRPPFPGVQKRVSHFCLAFFRGSVWMSGQTQALGCLD